MGELQNLGNAGLTGIIIGAVVVGLKIYEWKRVEPRREFCRYDRMAVSEFNQNVTRQHEKLLEAFGHLLEIVKDHEREEIGILTAQGVEARAQTDVLRELVRELRNGRAK